MNLTVLHKSYYCLLLWACKLLGRENWNAICQEHSQITIYTCTPCGRLNGNRVMGSKPRTRHPTRQTCPTAARARGTSHEQRRAGEDQIKERDVLSLSLSLSRCYVNMTDWQAMPSFNAQFRNEIQVLERTEVTEVCTECMTAKFSDHRS
jgi:hypothetical protein